VLPKAQAQQQAQQHCKQQAQQHRKQQVGLSDSCAVAAVPLTGVAE
jgi:hypothetical protein